MDREIFERLIWWTLARGSLGFDAGYVSVEGALRQYPVDRYDSPALIKRRAIQALVVGSP